MAIVNIFHAAVLNVCRLCVRCVNVWIVVWFFGLVLNVVCHSHRKYVAYCVAECVSLICVLRAVNV